MVHDPSTCESCSTRASNVVEENATYTIGFVLLKRIGKLLELHAVFTVLCLQTGTTICHCEVVRS
jgi:hypothetical protein